jgi:hypothetical protein
MNCSVLSPPIYYSLIALSFKDIFYELLTASVNKPRAGIKGERPGQSPRCLHKTEIESADFTETLAPPKPRKVGVYF